MIKKIRKTIGWIFILPLSLFVTSLLLYLIVNTIFNCISFGDCFGTSFATITIILFIVGWSLISEDKSRRSKVSKDK